ncbi:MAG TPA: alpha/beta-hydrolase family protein [Acidimicrobiia bacterium]|nr:alpha/beta-hydrolase family protein [Acidimicrobiia bacterium]
MPPTPVVFFSPSLFWRRPDWLLDGQRGVEISDHFQYTRLITGWQVMMDLPGAGSIPHGYGHLYTRQANVEAWIAVTRPDGWSEDDKEELIDFLVALGPSNG